MPGTSAWYLWVSWFFSFDTRSSNQMNLESRRNKSSLSCCWIKNTCYAVAPFSLAINAIELDAGWGREKRRGKESRGVTCHFLILSPKKNRIKSSYVFSCVLINCSWNEVLGKSTFSTTCKKMCTLYGTEVCGVTVGGWRLSPSTFFTQKGEAVVKVCT